jgi:Flp pilus assembly pilin Flp
MPVGTLYEWARRLRGERGAVATEYAVIITLVVLVTVVAMTAFGIAVAGLFERGVEPF